MLACMVGRTVPAEDLAERLASSLGLFDGCPTPVFVEGRAIFAQRLTRFDVAQGATVDPEALRPVSAPGRRRHRSAARGRWRPATTPSGRTVLFCGTLDNDDELRCTLSTRLRDPAALYGAAVDRWGDEADLRVVGSYASIVLAPERPALRLARSPWSAPPLHYFRNDTTIGAASALRALHVCGLSRQINRRKLADSMFNNLTEPEGWYEGGLEVQLGTLVHVSPASATRHTYYDHLAPRDPIHLDSLQHYVEAADALLHEAVRKALRGATKPAVQLTGGLDSSNVAARVLATLPAEQPVRSYTFVPHPDFDEPVPPNHYASEREKVERLAAMYPRLQPTFCDNAEDNGADALDRLFLAMGMAPDPLPNCYPLLGVFAAARADGCDLMLNAGRGNFNISQNGEWGFVEYLQTGRWIQLYRALRNVRHKTCSLPRRLFSYSLKPLLPEIVQRAIANRNDAADPPAPYLLTPLQAEAMARFGSEPRARAAGLLDERPFRTSRHIAMLDIFARGEMNGADSNLALEQVFGMPNRDVTAYRPLMEFCHAIPTRCFLNDGMERWLARELGRGHLPDEIRLERRIGMPQPDWHLRLSRRLPEIRTEIAEAANDPLLQDLVDFAELNRRIDAFPARPTHDYRELLEITLTLPRAVMAARFARFVSGRNAT